MSVGQPPLSTQRFFCQNFDHRLAQYSTSRLYHEQSPRAQGWVPPTLTIVSYEEAFISAGTNLIMIFKTSGSRTLVLTKMNVPSYFARFECLFWKCWSSFRAPAVDRSPPSADDGDDSDKESVKRYWLLLCGDWPCTLRHARWYLATFTSSAMPLHDAICTTHLMYTNKSSREECCSQLFALWLQTHNNPKLLTGQLHVPRLLKGTLAGEVGRFNCEWSVQIHT